MVPYRTFLFLGLAAAVLGAGYVFVPQSSTVSRPAASMSEAPQVASAATPAVPTARATTTQVANRLPVPFVTGARDSYYVANDTDASIQAASATDVGLPPDPGKAQSGTSSRAKAAVERDGYKNVHALEKGTDGVWRGRAMRGSTEIAIRVDDSGNVSAD